MKDRRPYKAKFALLSECGDYRYKLGRVWDEDKATMLWVMLNPSTANADEDDATIGRCVDFADAWGFGSILVGNVYAFRSTDPAGLCVCNPVGPENYEHLADMARGVSLVVCGWGATVPCINAHPIAVRLAMASFHDRATYCLGLTARGAPKHPLYLKSDTVPQIYSWPS